jgi:DNA polymerase-3 subunit alpha
LPFTFSLLDGLSKPEQIAARLKECGYAGSALTDHGTISGCPGFIDALGKKGLKPVVGCEFYVCDADATLRTEDNRGLVHLCVLATGACGWKNLMRASSASFRPEHSYHKPRLSLEQIGAFGGGEFIAFSGHPGSALANACFTDHRAAYATRSYDDAKALVHPDWEARVTAAVRRHQSALGAANFYLEIQLVDHKTVAAALVIARILRHVGRKLGVPRVATADSHYCRREDAIDQRVILCSALDITMDYARDKLDRNEDVQMGTFFRSNNYHIPDPEEMRELHGDHPEELAASVEIAGRCTNFKYDGKPLFPAFPGTGGLSQDEYLEMKCKEGWERLVAKKVPAAKHPQYRARLDEKELPVIRGTDGFLASYFNVKADIVRYARDDLRVKTGLGRGSAAGCLVSYLMGITRLDPIRFDLSFERFYNAGRNSPGRISLPDIDSDFPVRWRDHVIRYIRETYGADRVAQMATFSRMQGRGALKDVLRAHGRMSFEDMNRLTESVPDESEIADQLQLMMEETGEASIIRWTLENYPDALKEWAFLGEDGRIDGRYAVDFEQAIRLEGTKRNMGKHASGVIICSEPLADICPMVWDKSAEEMMVGVDMRDAEKMGLVKVDILGLRTLDCILDCESIIRTGRVA